MLYFQDFSNTVLTNENRKERVTFLELWQESKCFSFNFSMKMEHFIVWTVMLQIMKWSSFLVSEWLDLLVSSVKVTIILELYRRKWQGGNIYLQLCRVTECQNDKSAEKIKISQIRMGPMACPLKKANAHVGGYQHWGVYALAAQGV